MAKYCTNTVNSTGYATVQSGNETALLQTVAQIGPVRYTIYVAVHTSAILFICQNQVPLYPEISN